MFRIQDLDAGKQRLYAQLVDQLGPLGKPYLDRLLQAAYIQGREDGAHTVIEGMRKKAG